MAHRTIYRGPSDIDEPAKPGDNATGYFVQNNHGATVAGPYTTVQEAWCEQARRDAAERDDLCPVAVTP